MKKRQICLLLLALLALLLPSLALADAGPKPSVVVEIKGFEGQRYYATLLSSTDSTGPYWALEEGLHPGISPDEEDYDIATRFYDYKDADGFYFLQYFKECTETNRFDWTYYPPSSFKLLLYFPEQDSFLCTEDIYERYAFDSHFAAELSKEGALTLRQSYNHAAEILGLLGRIALTIALELLIALAFQYKGKKALLFIARVNVVTQVLLNLALNLSLFHLGWMVSAFFYVLMEIVVVIVEAVWYASRMHRYSQKGAKGRAVLYAICANLVSLCAGALLAFWVPGIF